MISNLFWCVMGIAGGAIISYIFYLKSQNRKRLTYEIKTFCIISNKINQIQGLEVKYNSREIENLYCSTITIRNIGNSIIKKQDLVPQCPISILTDGQLLNAGSYYIESLPQNRITHYNLSSRENDGICNCIEFDFDYIPQKAIITYSLFHTGDIKFTGDLIDGKITPVGNSRKISTFDAMCIAMALSIGIVIGMALMLIE